jgi:hypothetical protein
MTEDRLQYECVKWFYNTFPNHRGMLFEINNKTVRGAYRKGLGLVRGASDLMFLHPKGFVVPIELKVESSRHELAHLIRQYNWLEQTRLRGGVPFICTKLEDFIEIIDLCITFEHKERLTHLSRASMDRIKNIILNTPKEQKTVKI